MPDTIDNSEALTEAQEPELDGTTERDKTTELDKTTEVAESAGSPIEPHSNDLLGGDTHSQEEMHFAVVSGEPVSDVPKDLYIPPDALEVFLEAFEGPLDLLLYMIRKQNIDILEINVAEITHQYMSYIEMMKAMSFELAADYMVMAAMLAEIKSRMLLPRQQEEQDEDDPRAELIRRLQEYERFKKAAEDVDELPRLNRDIHQAHANAPDLKSERPHPEVDMKQVLLAFADVLKRVELTRSHHIQLEPLSTRERMSSVLSTLQNKQFVPFVSLFKLSEGRQGVIVTFLAIMELIKESLVEIVQNDIFGPIHVKSRAA